MKKLLVVLFTFPLFLACKEVVQQAGGTPTVQKEPIPKHPPFTWQGANVYFLLTDRFNNGNPNNDINFQRTDSTAVLRGFEGGDLQGITDKIQEGYFTDLGINAIWMSPVVEQIHGATDEGTGNTYGFHG